MNPRPWSFSALGDFTNCPRAYYEKRIAKSVQEEQNEAALWGDYVHKQFDLYLKAWRPDTVVPLPANLEMYREYLDHFARGSGTMYSECEYAITKEQRPCGFFAKDVWCRAIIDVLHLDGDTARAIDHKTGKIRHNTKQLKLSALMIFAHHPEIQEVKTGYFWLQDRVVAQETYAREQMGALWNEFVPELMSYRQAFHTETFNPKPSGLCYGWCPVTQCEFWKPKRVR